MKIHKKETSITMIGKKRRFFMLLIPAGLNFNQIVYNVSANNDRRNDLWF